MRISDWSSDVCSSDLKRGNSVYFPDRVVPMLPETLAADMCSLKEGVDRTALVCHLQVAKNGSLKSWRFVRATVRLAANIAYEDAQAAIDSGKGEHIEALKPLWDCWRALYAAREKREDRKSTRPNPSPKSAPSMRPS